MRPQELIEHLKQLPQDQDVWLYYVEYKSYDEVFYDARPLTSVGNIPLAGKQTNILVSDPQEGLRACIKKNSDMTSPTDATSCEPLAKRY